MPLFFFHVYDDGRRIEDLDGGDFDSVDDAKVEAVHGAKELAQQAIAEDRSALALCVEISDASGNVLAGLTVEEVLRHPAAPVFQPNCAEKPRLT